MENISLGWFELATMVSGAAAIVTALSAYRARARQRTRELEATKSALTAHYEAVNAIVDDPALPIEALEMLTAFTEAIAACEFCEKFADMVLNGSSRPKRGKLPVWFEQMEALRKTRPDLAEHFHKAIASGLVALFLRWPSNASKFELMVAEVAADGRREALLAERVSKIKRDALSKKSGNGDHHLPGGLVPA
jgi:hypothetical protein